MSRYVRVSAIFEDGTSVDNDKIKVSSDAEMQAVIDCEIAVSKEWYDNPKEFMVSIYDNDRCVNAYAVER